MLRTSLAALLGAAAFLTLAPAREAQAYPQWQFSSGAVRCNQCHFNPGGGGLITGYGRDKAADEMATWEGDGSFAHGVVELPDWLALGGDLRGAFLWNDVQNPGGSEKHVFPMQADLYARVALGDAWSVQASGGLRAQVRKTDADAFYAPGTPEAGDTLRFISREHFVMWRPSPTGVYARLGRFYAPFGLRLAEHIAYVRRDLGFNIIQETYNLSGGYVSDSWELHVTGFMPDFVREVGSNEKGAAAYFEKRLGEAAAVGLQGRAGFGYDGFSRYTGGVVGKLWIEMLSTLLLSELNVVQLVHPDWTRSQFVGAAGLAFFPIKGLMFTGLGERRQTDINVRDSGTTDALGSLSWFPYPHFEAQLTGRLQFPDGAQEPAKLLMFQLHYWL